MTLPLRTRLAATFGGVAAVLALLPAASLPAADAAAAPAPTLSTPTEVDAGKTLLMTGNAVAGSKVVVQGKVRGRFVALATTRATSGNTWRASVRFPKTPGTVAVRAVSGGKASTTRSVAVYAWLDLAGQPSVMTAAARDLTVRIGTRSFPHSILAVEPDTDQYTAYWRTGGACTDLRYTLGFDATEKSRADLDEFVTSQALGIRPDNTEGGATMALFAEWTRPQPFALSGLSASDRVAILVGANDADSDGLSGAIGRPQARCRISQLPPMRLSDVPPL